MIEFKQPEPKLMKKRYLPQEVLSLLLVSPKNFMQFLNSYLFLSALSGKAHDERIKINKLRRDK